MDRRYKREKVVRVSSAEGEDDWNSALLTLESATGITRTHNCNGHDLQYIYIASANRTMA